MISAQNQTPLEVQRPASSADILTVVIIYALFASAWMFISDRLLAHFIDDTRPALVVATLSRFLFVFVSSLLLYGLIGRLAHQPRAGSAGFVTAQSRLVAWPRWALYAFALATTLVTLLVRTQTPLSLGEEHLLILFIFPIVAAAALGGLGPGLLATAVSIAGIAVLASYTRHEPVTAQGVAGLAMLAANGLLVSALSEILHRSWRRELVHSQRLETAQEDLRRSQARFQATFDQAAIGTAQLAPDGRWLRVNRKLCEIVGYGEEELGSRTLQSITHPGDLGRDLSNMRRMLAREIGSYSTEQRCIRKDGSTVWVSLWLVLSWASSGEPEFFIAVVEDIQDRKRTEEALRKFSRVIEQTASTVMITDTQGIIEYVNPRFVEVTGYSAQQAIGQRPSLLKSGHTSQEQYAALWRTITDGDVWQGEFYNRRKDGSFYWESAIISPIRDERGRISHFAAVKDDITARKRVEAELVRSEERFKRLFRDAPLPLAVVNGEGAAVALNARFVQVFGYTREEVPTLAEWWTKAFPDADYRARAVGTWTAAMERAPGQEGDIEGLEYRITCKDGTERIMLVSGILLEEGFLATFFDVTERKRTELVLAEQEARYRAVIDTTSDGFWMLDKTGRILAVNDAYVRRSGYSRETLLSMWIGDLEAQESPDDVRAHMEKVTRRGTDLFETVHRTEDGELWPVEVSTSYVAIGGGLFFAFSRDITGRKALEREIIEVSTAEQERIGHEIHDSIGQELTGLAMLAGGLERRLAAAGHTEEAASAAQLQGHLQATLKEVRAFAHGLAPVDIDPEGLVDALVDLVEWVKHTSGVECRYRGSRKVPVEDSVTALHLYRLAQEALQNAIKHGAPTRVDLSLERGPESLVLTVRDNGKGIDIPEKRRRGLGLHIMRYRAGIMGGKCVIRRAEAGGTLVCCTVPLVRPALSIDRP